MEISFSFSWQTPLSATFIHPHSLFRMTSKIGKKKINIESTENFYTRIYNIIVNIFFHSSNVKKADSVF